MNILLVDDSKLFNDGLRLLIEKNAIKIQIQQLYKGNDVFDFLKKNSDIDVVFMDVNLGPSNGLDIARQLTYSYPSLKIILISVYVNIYQIADFKAAGVKGFILKSVEINELLQALQIVYNGGEYYIDNVKDAKNQSDDFVKKTNLSKREVELLGHILEGKTNPQIANEMSLSIHTIVAHRKNIHIKLGVKNERDLIKFAIQNGLT
jgi:DNA-binding NarL/FixJ family response regulator